MNCPPPVTVCQLCKELLIPETNPHYDQTSSGKRESYRDRWTLKHSADQGCFLCSRIRERLDPFGEETAPNDQDPPLSPDKLGRKWPGGTMLLYYPEGHHCEAIEIIIDPSMLQSSPERRNGIFFILNPLEGTNHTSISTICCLTLIESSMTDTVKRLPESTKSPATLSTAKEWISNCVRNHLKCKDVNPERDWYPTRLLDCGSQADTDRRCTLVETGTNVVTGGYMTLSHCWGLVSCMKLTTDNYDEMIRGVPSSQLPQLYQDALYVTRSLGVRYLWTDSLCIIQEGDNLADWNHEVTLMSKVYSRSLCNISASDAPDATHSLFNTRDTDTCFPETIECALKGITSRYLISEDRYWDTEVTRSLVNTRAWVLQERLLAPRVLHFGKRHLVWECKEKFASDAYPEGLPRAGTSSDLRLKGMFPRPGLSSREYRHIWQIIVHLYANCKLTFPGDRLVALSALARTMGGFMQQKYVAGMWRDNLELEMLWYVDGFFGASTPTTYRAPSWSWVASVGHLFPADTGTDGRSLIKVEEVHLDYVTDDTWGMLRGGWLHLRGHLNKLSLIDPEDWKMAVNGVQVEVSTEKDMQPNIYLDTPNNERDKDSKPNLYCMLARRGESRHENVVFILLLELVDGETATFKRIGLARGEVKDAQATFISPSEGEDEFPCLEYVYGQHLIRII